MKPTAEEVLYQAVWAYWAVRQVGHPELRQSARQWIQEQPAVYAYVVRRLQAALKAARRSLQSAWAPYSGFPVGAALVALDGTLWRGCNVECSSYGLTICAERGALSSAVVHHRRAFLALVLVSRAAAPIPPCGACRQVLYEFAPRLLVLSEAVHSSARQLWWLEQLLPEPFSRALLPR